MSDIRTLFDEWERERKLGFLEGCVELLVADTVPDSFEYLPLARSRFEAITSALEKRALLHAARSSLIDAKTSNAIDAHVFFDILEYLDSSTSGRALGASAWSNVSLRLFHIPHLTATC